MPFTLYTPDNAPEAAKAELVDSLNTFGWIPNLHAVMAEAPAVLTAYKQLHTLFQQTSFNSQELTVVWQTINVSNECHYCVPAHTTIATMMEVDADLINALRTGVKLPDPKLQILRETTELLMHRRGRLSDAEVVRFKAAGYGNQQLLEILLGISQKTLSNYTNHLAETPVDEQFSDAV